NTMLKTQDGGITFPDTITFPLNEYYQIGDIEFVNTTTGFVSVTQNVGNNLVLNNRIYKTENQGADWIEVYQEIMNWDTSLVGNNYPMINNIYAADENEVYGIGIACKIIKTYNGGTSWTTLNTPETHQLVTDISFITVDTGYMVSDHKLYKT